MLIVHNGRHKSGTTSLQHACADNRAYLASLGLLYPSSYCLESAHHPLARQLLSIQLKTSDHESIWRTIKREQEENSCPDVLVSSEVFQSIRRPSEFVKNVPYSEVLFVTYVRNLIDYFCSTYQQHVYATSMVALPTDRASQFNFRLMPFMTVLRRDLGKKIVFREFNRDKLVNSDIVQDFFVSIGRSEVKISGENRNPSIAGNLLLFKIGLNSFSRGQTARNILDALDGLALECKRYSGKVLLPEEIFRKLRREFLDDTQRVRELYLPSLELPDQPMGTDFDRQSWKEDLEFFLDRFSDLGLSAPARRDVQEVVDRLGVFDS